MVVGAAGANLECRSASWAGALAAQTGHAQLLERVVLLLAHETLGPACSQVLDLASTSCDRHQDASAVQFKSAARRLRLWVS